MGMAMIRWRKHKLRFLQIWFCKFFLAFFVMLPFSSHALESDWQHFDHSKVRLVAGQSALMEDGSLLAGLEFALEKDWKIYWRMPGDAGLPPEFDWAGSQNFVSATLEWPVPERFELFGISNNGYKDDTVFPIKIKAVDPGQPLSLALKVAYLICSDICVPAEAHLKLDVPATPLGASVLPSRHVSSILKFTEQVPLDQNAQVEQSRSLSILSARFLGQEDKGELTVVLHDTQGLAQADLFVETEVGDEGLIFDPPKITLNPDGKSAVLRIAALRQSGETPLTEANLQLTAVTGAAGRRYGVALPITTSQGFQSASVHKAIVAEATLDDQEPAPVSTDDQKEDLSKTLIRYATLLGIGFLGGLILNLMPCVLPVLSLKMLSVIQHGGQERKHIRIGFLATAAGILFSFLVLAGLAIGLRYAGISVGWGIQFQQPLFLTFMILLLVLFAANLWGWFEIPLPSWLINRVIVQGRDGKDHLSSGSLLANFSLGAFATLLATPCSAPFVGTAVSFALTSEAWATLLIFLVMGIGFAMPYILVSLWPALAQKMPKPGRWMVGLRAIMGVALAATAIWLLTVIAGQRGVPAAVAVGGLMTGVLALLWIRHRWAKYQSLLWIGVVLLGALAFFAPGVPKSMQQDMLAHKPQHIPEDDLIQWQVFDRASIAKYVAEGQTVFVDVTADWCITCKVNKKLVLEREAVAARFARDNIVALKADWTSPDPMISAYLQENDRFGIPFNIVYGPQNPKGIALPELLTESAVMEALDQAREISAAGRSME